MNTKVAYHHLFVFPICVLLCCSCIPASINPDLVDPTAMITDVALDDSWFRVYFSKPEALASTYFKAGPDEYLAAAIKSARLTVDVAIYNLNLWSIRDALLDAHARGVVVRVVAESDSLDGEEFQALISAGIPVQGDRRESIMHNKFVIIDRNEVWSGSMNFTLNGAYEDNNNILCIRSLEVAENFLVEFNEMFDEDLYGDDVRPLTPFPSVQIGSTAVEVYFSPDDGAESRLVELIEAASESIYFMAYVFTSDTLGEIIRSQAAAGVKVLGVMDSGLGASSTGTEFDNFLLGGLDVRLDGLDGLMHHKVIIIDEQVVITGSYNFTRSAEEKNDENVLIIHNPDIASTYMQEFWEIYNHSLRP